MTIKVGSNFFSAGGNVPHSVYGDQTLALALRAALVEVARSKVISVNPGDFTDSSTGTSAGSIVDLVVPTAAVDASSSAVGAPVTGFNTAVDKLENAMAVIAERMATTRAALGLTAVTYAGTVATAGTIAALDKTLTAASGTSAADFVSGKAKLVLLKANLRKLVAAYNEVLVAVGVAPIASALTEDFVQDYTIAAVSGATAAATGASALGDTATDTFLTAAAANVASLATKWNATFPLSATSAMGAVVVA